MAKKRERLDVIHDILSAIRDKNNRIGPTKLLHASNLSPQMYKDYIEELLEKDFIQEDFIKKKKFYSLTDKGFKFLSEFSIIRDFIEGFGL